MGIEEHGNSRKCLWCENKSQWKSGRNASFDDVPTEHKEVCFRKNMLSAVDPNKEEQECDHGTEEHKKIEDKESNIQLKSQRKFATSSDDAACSDNRFFMKYHDDEQLKKKLEDNTIDDADYIYVGEQT